jgi:hypothetical protein
MLRAQGSQAASFGSWYLARPPARSLRQVPRRGRATARQPGASRRAASSRSTRIGVRTRHDDSALRNLQRDVEVFVDRVALCVAGNDPHWLTHFADQTASVYRRRLVPMDDVVRLLEALRAGARGVLSAEEMVPADAALDEAVAVFRWYRRLAGDARKKNRLVSALYRGV